MVGTKKEDIPEHDTVHVGKRMAQCKKCGNDLPLEAKFCPRCGTAVLSEEAPAAYPRPADLRLAFWGERFVAWLIDVIIIGIIVGFLGFFTWFVTQSFTWWSTWPGWLPFFNFNLGGLFYFLYWMFMDGAYGQSIGKMIMHLKITRLDGSRINMGNAAVESVGKAFLLPLDILLGWILFPRRRQRIFNYLSETVVVHE
jgi:uncharacterized RDD family membrane protein YckC